MQRLGERTKLCWGVEVEKREVRDEVDFVGTKNIYWVSSVWLSKISLKDCLEVQGDD